MILKNRTYNVASGKSYSIRNILDNLNKLNFCPNLTFKKYNKGEVKIVRISNSKLNKKLKINNKYFTNIYNGLSETLIWYKNHLI